jgi:hypothetical protein
MLLKAVLVWLALLVIAIANGAIREAFLVSRFGAAIAHGISTATLCVAILLVAFAAVRWIHPHTAVAALQVGALWVALVLTFEFGFGHFVARKSWAELLADYNLFRGRVWVFVPAVTLISLLVAARARKLF